MIWACFNFSHPGALVFDDGRRNLHCYFATLQLCLLSYTNSSFQESCWFQHDNCLVYIEQNTQSWYDLRNLRLFQWLGRSLEIYSIEILSSILANSL